MKKIYLLAFAFISFIGISNVSAEILPSYSWSDAFTNTRTLQQQYDFFTSSSITDVINNLKSYYNSNLASTYQYYYIGGYPAYSGNLSHICLYASNSNAVGGGTVDNDYFRFYYYYDVRYCYRTSPTTEYIFYNSSGSEKNFYSVGSAYVYEFSTSFYYDHSLDATDGPTYQYYEEVIFPSYTSTDFDISSFSIFDNSPIPSIKSLYDDTYDSSDVIGYTEVNLNDYDYVILSLKNYNQTEAFDTSVLTLGQLCLTPVYDYGMREKSTYYSGYQVQGCSSIHTSFSPVRVYILEQDLQHNAVYYVKPFNTNIENKIKVDTAIFNITPISSANASNPSVIINGRSYPTIPYDDLSSTSTQSEEEGYISGESQPLFDISSNDDFLTDMFSHPLQTLQTIMTSITTMMSIIAVFIGMLPPVLSTFLMLSFGLSVILGILKIIL